MLDEFFCLMLNVLCGVHKTAFPGVSPDKPGDDLSCRLVVL